MPEMKEYTTIKGRKIEIDISPEACHPFGFLHGERIQTPSKGPATIIGVANVKEGGCSGYGPQLWYKRDNASGVSFWVDLITPEDFRRAGFKKI